MLATSTSKREIKQFYYQTKDIRFQIIEVLLGVESLYMALDSRVKIVSNVNADTT